MSVGERISALRKEMNISQQELAKRLEVTRQAVSKWENDQSSPDTLNLIRISDALNTDVEFLATGKKSAVKKSVVTVPVYQIKEVPVEKVVEKIVEKPVIRTVEKIVEKPVVQVLETEVVKIRKRTKYLRNPVEFIVLGLFCFLLGFLVGKIF